MHKSGSLGITGVRVQVEDVPGGGEGVSINQSCQEREVAGTHHHSFTFKNRSTNNIHQARILQRSNNLV